MATADQLVALGAAFLAAGLLARAGRRIELPTIPIFMLAGVLLGPFTPGVVLFGDAADLGILPALGLILLLFYIGLEFSLDELRSGGRPLLGAGIAYIALNVGGGLAFGFALGWGTSEALVLAGVLGISSSAIVSKLLTELGRVGDRESQTILGIIVLEDVFLAFYLALLAPALGRASGLGEAAVDVGLALAVLLTFASLARWGSRQVTRLVDAQEDELLVLCFVGLVLLAAGLAEELGVKYAIAALMVGMVLGAGPARERITAFVHPLRDAFGALFFFGFGLTIDPGGIGEVAVPIAVAVALTFALNVAAGAVAARLNGFDRREGANVAFTLVARGEFALVLAALAAAAGLDGRIVTFTAGYVLVLAILGPLSATRTVRVARG